MTSVGSYKKYSIISPSYNETQHVKSCIVNILEQIEKYKIECHIIIVDDCSTDGTWEDLLELQSERLTVLKTPINSGGAGSPRNIGLEHANSEYVLFYDFGDIIDLSRLEEIGGAMTAKNAHVAIANHVDIQQDGKIIRRLSYFRDQPYCTDLKALPRLINNPFCWGKVYNLKWLRENQIRFGDQYCGEDKIFTWKAYLSEQHILIHPHILYGHRFFGEHVNRMLQINSRLIDSIISIDREMYPEFAAGKLAHIYSKRVLRRDLLEIVFSTSSRDKLKSLGEYEQCVVKIAEWLVQVITERSDFHACLNVGERQTLRSILGGTIAKELDEDREFYLSDEYLNVLKGDSNPIDPMKVGNFIIALHLPQFHPDSNNDKNWGKGFTEWTNVSKALPLYPGHLQPKLPTDLGFYDLRLHESRIEQMRLAKYHGIDAFCYYHYWFSGATVLETPLKLMLDNQKENFPFMLCWANETWSGVWHGSPDRILIEQKYQGESDYIAYFNHLLPFFKDYRYLKTDNKPMFAVWQPSEIPDPSIFLKIFETLAMQHGFNGMHMIGIHHWHRKIDPLNVGFQRSIPMYMPPRINTTGTKPTIHDLEAIHTNFLPAKFDERYYPCITPNWDNTPRSGTRGMIFENSYPGLFARQIKDALDWSKEKSTEKILFIKAWNEWAEGNYLEPDRQWGRSYLNVLKQTLGR